jgi:hypothetical protein
MNSLKELKQLKLTESLRKHPKLPEAARYIKPYSDKTANGLTRAIIDFLRLKGHQAERISSSGRYIDGSKVVTDTLGFKRRIGSGKWILGSMQPGSADLSAVIQGKAVKIEVKMKDRQSPAQKKYQEQVERAGGLYWLVRSFDEFIKYYNG